MLSGVKKYCKRRNRETNIERTHRWGGGGGGGGEGRDGKVASKSESRENLCIHILELCKFPHGSWLTIYIIGAIASVCSILHEVLY